MKKRIVLILLLIGIISLTSCGSSVSQKDYDALVNKNKELENQLAEKNDEYMDLYTKYNNLRYSDKESTYYTPTDSSDATPTVAPTNVPTVAPTQPPANTTETDTSGATLEQKNAINKALSYLNMSAFSYSGLIEQLEYEGFSTESATYAVDNCGADWNEQAAKKAQSYLDMTSFSRESLIEQLVYEGFSSEQAEYGVTAVGY